jgi:hypothetical protein
MSETEDIARTVHPDRKLIAETLIISRLSRRGFMMTPPPMPHMAPIVDAKDVMRK